MGREYTCLDKLFYNVFIIPVSFLDATRVLDSTFFQTDERILRLASYLFCFFFSDDNRKVWTSRESEFVDSTFFLGHLFLSPSSGGASMRLSVPDVPTGIPHI